MHAVKLTCQRTTVLVMVALTFAGCGHRDDESSTQTTPLTSKSTTASATTTTSPTPLAGDAYFAQQLREGGILVTEDQVPSLIPVAHQACDLTVDAPGTLDERYSRTIDLLMAVGSGKNIFQTLDTTRVFMKAATYAYCPEIWQ